jgi:hypothetical protein
MICSARASLPPVYNRDGDVKQNRWVSSFCVLFFSHNFATRGQKSIRPNNSGLF